MNADAQGNAPLLEVSYFGSLPGTVGGFQDDLWIPDGLVWKRACGNLLVYESETASFNVVTGPAVLLRPNVTGKTSILINVYAGCYDVTGKNPLRGVG